MKNKILFISLAVVLAVSMGLIGCAPSEEEPEIPIEPTVIKVGMSRDVNGIFEMGAFGPAYRCYFAEINAAGGLHLKEYDTPGDECRVPIEVVRLDDGDDTAVSAANIELLITDYEVDFLWGACGTSHIFSQAPVANYWEYVLMTAEGGATELKTSLPGMPYVFCSLSFSDWYQIPVLAKILAEAHEELEPGDTPTAYITFISEQHGTEYTQVSREYFEKEGIEILKTVGHPYLTLDWTEIIAEAKSMDPDIFCCWSYPQNVWPCTLEAVTQDFNPKAFVCGPGANFGNYAYTPESGLTQDDIEGVMSFTVAAYGVKDEIDEVYEKVAAQIESEIGLPPGAGMGWVDYWGHPCYWAAMQMWQHAIEEVGYVSQDALKDELRSYDTPANGVETILGNTWFHIFGNGGGIIAYECHYGEIAQWINGKYETIGYDGVESDLTRYVVTEDYVYPKTPFP